MTPALLPLLAVLLAAPAAEPAAARTEKAAASYEEAAFSAIDEQRWCGAARLFLQAETLAPNPTLLVNAAEAAVEAGDLQLAVELLDRASKRSTRTAKRKIKRRLKTVRRKLKKKGSPVVCDLAFKPLPEPPPAAPDEGPPASTEGSPEPTASPPTGPTEGLAPEQPAPDKPAGAAGATAAEGAQPSAAPAPQLDAAAPPPAGDTQDPHESSAGAWLYAAGGGLAGVGVVAGFAAGAAVAVGAWPWVAHAAARQSLEDASAAGTTGAEVAALQDAQATHRARWESWGLPLSVVGWAALGLSAVVVAGGAAVAAARWFVGGDGEASE